MHRKLGDRIFIYHDHQGWLCKLWAKEYGYGLETMTAANCLQMGTGVKVLGKNGRRESRTQRPWCCRPGIGGVGDDWGRFSGSESNTPDKCWLVFPEASLRSYLLLPYLVSFNRITGHRGTCAGTGREVKENLLFPNMQIVAIGQLNYPRSNFLKNK